MQLAVSLAGTALTATGLVTLRRYVLSAPRLARSRLRGAGVLTAGFPGRGADSAFRAAGCCKRIARTVDT